MMNPVRVPERPSERLSGSSDEQTTPPDAPEPAARLTDVAELFHQLNNQLGIILANAELLELKARDETSRARAAQVVSSVLEALATARVLRKRLEP
jgi:hypothetical protein